MIRQNLSTGRGELFPMLLKAGQYGEIALIQYRTAVPLDIARACALLLFGTTVLRHGGVGNEKQQTGGDKKKFDHRDLWRGKNWAFAHARTPCETTTAPGN
jgi:hypothetical protein